MYQTANNMSCKPANAEARLEELPKLRNEQTNVDIYSYHLVNNGCETSHQQHRIQIRPTKKEHINSAESTMTKKREARSKWYINNHITSETIHALSVSSVSMERSSHRPTLISEDISLPLKLGAAASQLAVTSIPP